jgi:hypothetical protein
MTEIPVPDPNTPSVEPPNAFVTGSTGLSPDVKLPKRIVTGAVKDIQINQEDVIGATGPSVNETTSARARELSGPTSFGYVGQNLVDGNGTLVRGQYDPSGEAYSELAKMPLAERLSFLNSLQARGLYGSSRPSTTGFDTKDFSAMSEFLRFANAQGVTADVAQTQLLTMFPASGGGRAIRTTAKADIRSVFKNTTRQLLGRDLSPDEIEKFVKAYEGKEIAQATGGVKAPSLQTAAEVAVQQQHGGEAQAMGMANLMDILDKKIKGLA